MADQPGQPRPDLTNALTSPETMGFFELLRRFETEKLRFGRSGGAGDEPARLGQRVRLSIATRDVAGVQAATDTSPARIDVEVLGLLGPEGAMPLHVTRWVMERLSQRWFADAGDRATADTTFLDFCNMLQHRMLALYWRSWGDARPEVQIELGTGGRTQALLASLAGTSLPGMSKTDHELALKLRHGTSLAMAAQGPERLTRFLSDLIGAPVRLVEFVGHWLELPAHLQTRLSSAHAVLGQTAVVGARSFQRQGRAELRIGPLDLDVYQRLVDDHDLRARIRHAIRFAVGRDTIYDLRPVLARQSVPEPRIGAARLGRTGWLPSRVVRDPDDLRLSDFTRNTNRVAA